MRHDGRDATLQSGMEGDGMEDDGVEEDGMKCDGMNMYLGSSQ